MITLPFGGREENLEREREMICVVHDGTNEKSAQKRDREQEIRRDVHDLKMRRGLQFAF